MANILYLDNPVVRIADLEKSFDIPEGLFKLITCYKYRKIVFNRLKLDLIELGMATNETNTLLGLSASNIYQSKIAEDASLKR
ncbi:hypothetical protein [Glaciecola sp. MF2-115]|uniref:hypothetical protein n=1 Tax=Glaciecola sp. MF2-115 TaxID=3384827 RepID=UPI00399F31A6